MRGSWRPNKDCNILTPELFWPSQHFFPVLPSCSTGGLGAQLSAESWFPQLDLERWLQALNSNCSIGGLVDPLYWVLVLSTTSYLQLTDFLSSPGLYNCSTSTFFWWASQIALNSTRPRSRLYPDIPRPEQSVIYTGAFPILTAWPGRWSICNRLMQHTRCDTVYPDTLRPAVFVGSWFRWKSVETVWHVFRETDIQDRHPRVSVLCHTRLVDGTFDKYRCNINVGPYISLTLRLDCNHYCRSQPTLHIAILETI